MPDPIGRNHSSIHDNQTYSDDYAPDAGAGRAGARPAAQRPAVSAGAAQLVAQHSRRVPKGAARAQPQPRGSLPQRTKSAGFVGDAVKIVGPKALGPLGTPAEVAALCMKYPVQCATAAQGALIAGAGYVLYEATIGAEPGPLPPAPGGSCGPAEPADDRTATAPSDPCERESSLECLPKAYRDGSE